MKDGQDERAFLSSDGCRDVFRRITRATTGGGATTLALQSRWAGTTQWMRNRIVLAADTQSLDLTVGREVRGRYASATTTRIDEPGIREVVEAAERTSGFFQEEPVAVTDTDTAAREPVLEPVLWSDATYRLPADRRTELARAMAAGAEAEGLFCAGELAIAGEGHAAIATNGMFRYYPVTAVECSVTVRNAAGTASGWAGGTHYDLAKIDPSAIAARALDKCRRSENPRAAEPGRYTVILEPQAVHDLVAPLIENSMERGAAEVFLTPFAGRSAESWSKIGSQVIDRRLTVDADPLDPEAGFLPFSEGDGTPYRAVTWIEEGVLRELAYDRFYAVRSLGTDAPLLNSGSFHLRRSAGVPETSIEEMIASTKRGLLVTRFSDVRVLHQLSMLCSGYTRDGLWLIADGKITMPIKNFRFTDSPMFALNNVEAIGPAARAFSPGYARVVPALKVRDFNFTSLADAV